MQRSWAVCAALVLLAVWGAGCGGQPAADQAEIKQAYIRQLVGFCAEVVRQLAKIDVKAQPGMAADEFAGFVGQARSRPAPDTDRAQLEIMLTEIDGTVGHYRSAQTALSVSDRPAYQAALALADRQMMSADAAAQKYGMPPLGSCPEHESPMSPAPNPSAAPPPAPAVAGWESRRESSVAVQQVGAAVCWTGGSGWRVG